jgi:hypothetical protein
LREINLIAIFDMSTVNVIRYNDELLKGFSGDLLVLVDDPDLFYEVELPNLKCICSSGFSIDKLKKTLNFHNVSAIYLSGQRPADIRVIIAANQLGIKIIYKMHGLYVPFMKRNMLFYISNFRKALRTSFYLFDIIRASRSIRIAVGILLSFVFGLSRAYWAKSEMIRIDYALVWSKYWEEWHKAHWFISPRSGWILIGNPDSLKFRREVVSEKYVSYIYQTLVEDGRISKALMYSFYRALLIVSQKYEMRVIVKWHPRGSDEHRLFLESLGFEISDNLPLCNTYIGHYSSLLGLVPIVRGRVFIFELEGHPTPESIANISNQIFYDLSKFQLNMDLTEKVLVPKLEEAKFYFGEDMVADIELRLLNELVGGTSKEV